MWHIINNYPDNVGNKKQSIKQKKHARTIQAKQEAKKITSAKRAKS
jgi:hypothetical protein